MTRIRDRRISDRPDATAYIYGLYDPRTDCCRYVGKTLRPTQRLGRHLKDGNSERSDHKSCWIRRLAIDGISPTMKILERCPNSEWRDWERWWMAEMRRRGCDLTNSKDGGNGADVTEEVRMKMSAAKKGRPALNKGKPTSEDAKRKQSESAKRRWNARTREDQIAYQKMLRDRQTELGAFNYRKPGWKHSDEAKRKIRESMTPERIAAMREAGREKTYSPEAIAKRVASNTGKKRTPEQIERITQGINQGLQRKFERMHRCQLSLFPIS